MVKKKKKKKAEPVSDEHQDGDPNKPVIHGLKDVRLAKAQQLQAQQEAENQAKKQAKVLSKKPGVAIIKQAAPTTRSKAAN